MNQNARGKRKAEKRRRQRGKCVTKAQDSHIVLILRFDLVEETSEKRLRSFFSLRSLSIVLFLVCLVALACANSRRYSSDYFSIRQKKSICTR